MVATTMSTTLLFTPWRYSPDDRQSIYRSPEVSIMLHDRNRLFSEHGNPESMTQPHSWNDIPFVVVLLALVLGTGAAGRALDRNGEALE